MLENYLNSFSFKTYSFLFNLAFTNILFAHYRKIEFRDKCKVTHSSIQKSTTLNIIIFVLVLSIFAESMFRRVSSYVR